MIETSRLWDATDHHTDFLWHEAEGTWGGEAFLLSLVNRIGDGRNLEKQTIYCQHSDCARRLTYLGVVDRSRRFEILIRPTT